MSNLEPTPEDIPESGDIYDPELYKEIVDGMCEAAYERVRDFYRNAVIPLQTGDQIWSDDLSHLHLSQGKKLYSDHYFSAVTPIDQSMLERNTIPGPILDVCTSMVMSVRMDQLEEGDPISEHSKTEEQITKLIQAQWLRNHHGAPTDRSIVLDETRRRHGVISTLIKHDEDTAEWYIGYQASKTRVESD